MSDIKNIKTTSLDYAILGLVHILPQSGYAIRKQFELTAIGNYSSSPGAIYPALKRLQKFGLVENILFKEDRKNKYQCTSLG
ncbi:MAG: PadR family transcriptional regulator, partial [Cyclobacteriaceae bacterium]|nr:PadR family transcriptional regulator [Cyclobacteriaceae bacterium]